MRGVKLFLIGFLFGIIGLVQRSCYDVLFDDGYVWFGEGNVKVVFFYFEEVEKVILENFSIEGKVNFYNDIGVVYYQIGEYKKGFDFYQCLFDFYKKFYKDSIIIVFLFNIGFVYKEIGFFCQVIFLLIEVVCMVECYGDRKVFFVVWNVIGNIQMEMGNFEKVLNYYQ